MNRDLLLGLVIPGEDRFEIRGWVRWLLGTPSAKQPEDPDDLRRFHTLHELDPDAFDALREAALAIVTGVRGIEGSGAHQRGVQAHDHLMQHLLSLNEEDSIRHAVLAGDTQQLLSMLELESTDMDDVAFNDGFRWANRSLAEAVGQRLDAICRN